MKRLVVIVALSMLTITGSVISFSTPALAANESDIYLKVESFTWKEFNDNGTQLLKESGPIYGLGASAKSDISKTMTLKFKGELFGGSIDYDGQTQAGTPAKTDTEYFGFKMEGDAGWKFMVAEKSSLEPFAGLGWRWWNRDIQSTATAIGYEERWSTIYARLGIRGDHAFSNQLKGFTEAGVKLPIYTENEIDWTVFGLDTITLEPGNEASVFAEVGVKWAMLKVSVFYEGMRFSKSDLDDVYNAIYQPESKADIYGVNVGMAF